MGGPIDAEPIDRGLIDSGLAGTGLVDTGLADTSPTDKEIVVERDGPRLVAFSWQGQRYPVGAAQVLGTPPTRWWDGESERTYVRVTARGRLYELSFDHERKAWVLVRKL